MSVNMNINHVKQLDAFSSELHVQLNKIIYQNYFYKN